MHCCVTSIPTPPHPFGVYSLREPSADMFAARLGRWGIRRSALPSRSRCRPRLMTEAARSHARKHRISFAGYPVPPCLAERLAANFGDGSRPQRSTIYLVYICFCAHAFFAHSLYLFGHATTCEIMGPLYGDMFAVQYIAIEISSRFVPCVVRLA